MNIEAVTTRCARGADRDEPGAPSSDLASLRQFKELSSIFDSMAAVVYVADLETYELLYMNSYAQELFGRGGGVGNPCFEVLQLGQKTPCAFCTNHRLVRGGEPQPPYLWEFRNTVTGRWFRCIDRAIRWPDGRLVRLEVAVDISDQKRAEALLREANQTLEGLIEASPLAIVSMDRSGRVTLWSKGASHLFGWQEQEVLGKAMPPVHAGDRNDFDAVRARTGTGAAVTGMETVARRKDGSVIEVSVSAAPLRDARDRVTGSMAVIADISERRRIEEFRRQYIHTISHDLRNPLSVVDGYAQLLRDTDVELNDRQRSYVEGILSGARRINVMIQDLVDSARHEGGDITLERAELDLRSAISRILEENGRVLPMERVRLDLAPDLARVFADPDRLERILLNLLSNALKYSDADVLVSAADRGPYAEISIVDQGVGIARDDIAHVFDRYFRAQAGRAAGGMGLGLYITRLFVEAHGGSIRVDSEPGKGSTFTFTIPTSQGS